MIGFGAFFVANVIVYTVVWSMGTVCGLKCVYKKIWAVHIWCCLWRLVVCSCVFVFLGSAY